MKKYESPEMKITVLAQADVIVTSGLESGEIGERE